jgi:hypothetical protein
MEKPTFNQLSTVLLLTQINDIAAQGAFNFRAPTNFTVLKNSYISHSLKECSLLFLYGRLLLFLRTKVLSGDTATIYLIKQLTGLFLLWEVV